MDDDRSHEIRTGTSDGAAVVSRPVVPTRLEVGEMVEAESGSRYEILEKLGKGGMAEVYRARAVKPTGIELEVALKCLVGTLGEDGEAQKLFISEARLSTQLQHPNIARAFDLERIGGTLYLVLEYVDGVSLKAVLGAAAARKEPMSSEFVCYVGACVADALHHANARRGLNGEALGIVHRDLSASNVMVTRSGIPKLIDFGIAYARLAGREGTRTGVVRGTYSYLSPEQAAAGRAALGQVDGRSDLFSLGLLLVELLTGEQVFGEQDEYLTVRAIAECNRERVEKATRELPTDLQRVCRRLLERRRDARYQTGEQLAIELHGILAERDPLYGPRECVVDLVVLGAIQLPQSDKRTREVTGRPARRGRGRRWGLVVGAALGVGVGVGALGVKLVGRVNTTTSAVGSSPLAAAESPAKKPFEPEPPVGGGVVVAKREPTPEELGWPGGVPVRRKKKPTPQPLLQPAAQPVPEGAAEPLKGKASVSQGALLRIEDRGIVANAKATLPRGTVLRVKLSGSINASQAEVVEAVVTEEAREGNVVVERGSVVSCWTRSINDGRLNLSCDAARSKTQVWQFSGLALGDGDRAGLRVENGRVAAGTTFTVAVTASAIVD